MLQSKLASFYEAVFNTMTGFLVSMPVNHFLVPALYGTHSTLTQDFVSVAIFTVLSIARGYIVRRFFNHRLHQAALRLAGENQ